MGSSLKDNQDVACYFITKHSWKGKFVFVFVLFLFILTKLMQLIERMSFSLIMSYNTI